MNAAKLLATAHEAGIRTYLDGQSQLRLAYSRDTDPALLDQLRASKPAIVAHLRDDWMPAGLGRCPDCREFTMLPAGPTTTVCDACALLADEAEITVRGEAGP